VAVSVCRAHHDPGCDLDCRAARREERLHAARQRLQRAVRRLRWVRAREDAAVGAAARSGAAPSGGTGQSGADVAVEGSSRGARSAGPDAVLGQAADAAWEVLSLEGRVRRGEELVPDALSRGVLQTVRQEATRRGAAPGLVVSTRCVLESTPAPPASGGGGAQKIERGCAYEQSGMLGPERVEQVERKGWGGARSRGMPAP